MRIKDNQTATLEWVNAVDGVIGKTIMLSSLEKFDKEENNKQDKM